MPRINLHLSDDLYEEVVRAANRAGVRHTDWLREAAAFRLGRLCAIGDLGDLAARVQAIERHLELTPDDAPPAETHPPATQDPQAPPAAPPGA